MKTNNSIRKGFCYNLDTKTAQKFRAECVNNMQMANLVLEKFMTLYIKTGKVPE